MFHAAVFDMDGTLIDSEAYWRIAEREVFGAVGIEITDAMATVTAPMTPRQVCEHWYRVRPWPGADFERMAQAVVSRVAEQMRDRCDELPGVRHALDLCDTLGLRVALASNSPASLCELALERLGLARRFQTVVSADDVEHGKPDPAIYLLAAGRLGVEPADCVAFEDSGTGARAAIAAGMRVVVIPSAGQDFSALSPDLKLQTLADFTEQHARALWESRAQRVI